MEDNAVFVVVEVISVRDPAGLKTYIERASQGIGLRGGAIIGRGNISIEGEEGFAPIVIQRWPSEKAFRDWLDSEEYKPLHEIQRASSTMRAAIVPIVADPRAA